MTTFKVVCMHIFSNSLPCFSDIVVLGQIGFLVLETPEPSFNHDIISPAAFTIHALTDLVLFEKVHVLIACELTALIRKKALGSDPIKDTPFVVINADDYYGKEGFKKVHEYLVNGGTSCMAGFVLKNPLFNRRLRNLKIKEDADISAYTISTSFGCVLSATEQQCRFCETGTLKFGGHLRAEDIALQCIFMAEYDSNCPSYKQVRNNAREFAFMGQGEPGYCYPAIKRAIMYTDYVMDKLGQKVSRYVISTCGVTEFIQALTEDLKNSVFKNKITIHLSLHEIDEKRNELMPINNIYDYQEVIACCKKLYQVTNEKIGVGILMFDKYQTKDGKSYTLTPKRLEEILSVLDNDVFRIDLCFVNNTDAGRQKHELSNEMADALFQVVLDKGFEGKIFTSFGDMQKSGCGMLSSSMENKSEVGSTTIEHFNKAVQLLQEVKEYCYER